MHKLIGYVTLWQHTPRESFTGVCVESVNDYHQYSFVSGRLTLYSYIRSKVVENRKYVINNSIHCGTHDLTANYRVDQYTSIDRWSSYSTVLLDQKG